MPTVKYCTMAAGKMYVKFGRACGFQAR